MSLFGGLFEEPKDLEEQDEQTQVIEDPFYGDLVIEAEIENPAKFIKFAMLNADDKRFNSRVSKAEGLKEMIVPMVDIARNKHIALQDIGLGVTISE